jgi:hypothetical protein
MSTGDWFRWREWHPGHPAGWRPRTGRPALMPKPASIANKEYDRAQSSICILACRHSIVTTKLLGELLGFIFRHNRALPNA